MVVVKNEFGFVVCACVRDDAIKEFVALEFCVVSGVTIVRPLLDVVTVCVPVSVVLPVGADADAGAGLFAGGLTVPPPAPPKPPNNPDN